MKDMLKELGFSPYKADAFMALVRISKGTISDIAKHSDVPSNKLYHIMQWLLENGYVTQVSQKPLTYMANNPKEIMKIDIREKVQRLESLQRDVDNLALDFGVVEKRHFHVIYGRDAYFRKIKESHANMKDNVFAIIGSWRYDSELIGIEKRKVSDGVRMRFLGPIDKRTMSRVDARRSVGIQCRHLKPDETRYTVWDDRIVALKVRDDSKKSTEDYYSMWIDSPTLARILRSHFDMLWKSAEKKRV